MMTWGTHCPMCGEEACSWVANGTCEGLGNKKPPQADAGALIAQSEPVAWQDLSTRVITTSSETAKCWQAKGDRVRPLYTHPAPPPAGEGVVREALVDVLASLAAAVSLLEHTPKLKKMFDQMILDYKASLERGRAAALSATPQGSGEQHSSDGKAVK